MHRLVITRINWEKKDRLIYAQLDESRKLYNFQVFEEEQEQLVGKVFVGRIDSVSANLNAAFVKIGKDQMAYLPLPAEEPVHITRKLSPKPQLKAGDELLVQVTRDAIKTKLPQVTARLSLSGTYSILNSGSAGCGVSRKISQKKAAPLKELGKTLLQESGLPLDSVGLLLRTNAGEIEPDLLSADINRLICTYRMLTETAVHQALYSCLWSPSPSWVQKLKGVKKSEIEALITDQPDVYQAIAAEFPEYEQGVLSLYNDSALSLTALYSLRAQLERLTKRQIWLKSGANIIIEQLETLTFIDVNTAKNQSEKPGLVLSVNIEAAGEIARQLRMRNISGMILIDFINMDNDQDRQELICYLKAQLQLDSIPCNFVDITKLGLVELTRKKVYKSLCEIL